MTRWAAVLVVTAIVRRVHSQCEPFDQKGGWHPKDLDDRVTVACTHNGSPVGLDQDAPAFTECTATCSSDTYVGMNNMENHYRCDGNSVAGLDNGCRANNSWIVTGRNFIFCSKPTCNEVDFLFDVECNDGASPPTPVALEDAVDGAVCTVSSCPEGFAFADHGREYRCVGVSWTSNDQPHSCYEVECPSPEDTFNDTDDLGFQYDCDKFYTSQPGAVGDKCYRACEFVGNVPHAASPWTCGESGEWIRDGPEICEPVKCPDIEQFIQTVEGASVTECDESGFACEIECISGYEYAVDVDDRVFTCNATTFYGYRGQSEWWLGGHPLDRPACLRDISCGSFTSFLAAEGLTGISSSGTTCTRRVGGVLSPSDANSRNEDWCRFSCADGFQLENAGSYKCQPRGGSSGDDDDPSVGVWTGGATCESVTPCGSFSSFVTREGLPGIASTSCDGALSPDDSDASLGHYCSFECAEGYHLSRTFFSTGYMCTRSDDDRTVHHWEGHVTCGKDCAGPRTPGGLFGRLGNVASFDCRIYLNGFDYGGLLVYDETELVMEANTGCSFECNEGYSPYEANQNYGYVCGSGQGQWGGSATCAPDCKAPNLPESSGGLDASSIPNGNVVCVHDRESGNLANDGAMRAGTVCTVECDHGYGLADADAAAAATCGPDGSWSGEIAQCLPVQCPPFKDSVSIPFGILGGCNTGSDEDPVCALTESASEPASYGAACTVVGCEDGYSFSFRTAGVYTCGFDDSTDVGTHGSWSSSSFFPLTCVADEVGSNSDSDGDGAGGASAFFDRDMMGLKMWQFIAIVGGGAVVLIGGGIACCRRHKGRATTSM